ncbi:choice-of-anchor D domain-containing protein [Labilibacter sediminis]|nr:choice-of-anchor D domain-containing protein [Labilibacter sediminis]
MNSFTQYHTKNILIFILFLFCITPIASAQKVRTYQNGVLQGSIKIKLIPGLQVSSTGLKSTSINGYANVGINNIDRLNQEYKAVKMERLFRYSPKYETRHQKHGLHLWYKVEVNSEEDIQQILKAYNNIHEVEQAELFFEKKLIPYNITPLKETGGVITKSITKVPFNDPRLNDQWHYNNNGQTGGTPGADINLYKAWEKQAGNPNIIVSIIDEGVDYSHEDLNANMWINEAEFYGAEGVDDDENGFVDDIYGYNFAEDKGDVDPLEHGTHVGGTVAAVNNNGIGVAGVAGGTGNNDGVRIMSAQIMGSSSYGLPEEAFVYAADNGSVISQNSWGYNEPDIYEQSILDAIDYYIAEAGNYEGSPMKGGVVIFAAGNLGKEGKYWPGCYEKVIAVTATGSENELASYSNYGDWIDVTAPGGNVDRGQTNGVLSTMPDNSYGFYDGTSMACPHVSGVAALIASQYGGEEFDNEMLKSRLLSGLNVIDTMEVNLHWAGKIGLGAADAYLALQNDEGIAPDKITDLVGIGTSRDFALFQWTVPTDEDDDNPRYFDVYYSTEPFDEATVDIASKIRIESTLYAGELYEYELNDLAHLTEYYVAVKGIDRWGNASGLSNRITISTNNGPGLSLTPELIEFSINVDKDTIANKQFTISNSGDGLLKWSLTPRHVENTDIYENEVNPLSFYHFSPSTASKPAVGYKELSNSDFEIELHAQEQHNDWLFHFDEAQFAYTLAVIGEQNQELPNSMATHFEVKTEDGFNLTSLELGLNIWEEMDAPVIIEIRKGSELSGSKLIYTQNLFYGDVEGGLLWEVDLNEQIYFNRGDEFWLVVHTPPGLEYPLLAAQGQNYESTDHSYFSSDLGNSWSLLRDIYYDYTKVWAVTAWSKLIELDEYIQISPTSGYIAPGEIKVVDIEVDASDLINGDYRTNVVVFTNEENNEIGTVKLEYDVTGHPFELSSADITDFGNVFIGEALSKIVKVENNGLGAFASTTGDIDIQISHPDFRLISDLMEVIPAEREETFEFKYTPTNVGPANAVVTLTEQNGQTYSFSLYGAGSDPAKAVINPENTYHNDITLGDETEGSFYLRNDGAYPLRYYIPKFADGSNMPDFDGRFIHKYGYAAVENEGDIDSPAFEWIDISETGTDVSEVFRLNSTVTYQEALVGFKFPFFGNEYDTCYITKWGAITFSTDGWFNSNPASYKNKAQPGKLVCAWGMPFYLEDGGKILYQQFPGKLIVQYQDVPHGSYYFTDEALYPVEWQNYPITFQIVLHDDGSIEFNYKDLSDILNTTSLGFNRASCLITIEDRESVDGLILNGYGSSFGSERKTEHPPTTGHQIFFKSPGYGVLESLTNPYGTVNVGDSVKINYIADTDSLSVDQFEERINIISNDPINNLVTHTINMDITSGGVRNLVFEPSVIDFGNVFQGATKTHKLKVLNTGKAVGTLIESLFINGNFSIKGYMPVDLKANTFTTYEISIDAVALGIKDDILQFTDEEGTVYQIPVKASVVDAPYISSDKEMLDVVLNHGERLDTVVSINNTGNNPMLVSPISHEWYNLYPKGISEHSTEVDYDYFIERDPSSVYNNWMDIVETGERLEVGDPLEADSFWIEVPLSTSIPFYGIEYDTLYVGHTGVITFTKGQEGMIWGPESEIPDTSSINNYLAPMFGFHGLSWIEAYPKTGLYVQEYEDKVVILFQELSSNFGLGLPVSCEVVIYKTGVIKYLYSFTDDEDAYAADASLVGIENQDGSKGIQAMNKSKQFLYTGTTITFIPHEYYQVEANSTLDFDLKVNALSLYDGLYSEDILFKNNTPSDPEFTLPINLEVIGKDSIIVEDTLALGELLMVEHDNTDYTSPYKRYDFDFTLNNQGSKSINIKNVKLLKGFNYGITMGDDNKFGNGSSEDGWVDISRRLINFSLRPLNKETFRLRVFPLSEAIIEDTIMVYSNDLAEGVIKIPVSAVFSLPPVVGYPSEGIDIYAENANHVEDSVLTINNTQGSTTLTYNIEIEFERAVKEDPVPAPSSRTVIGTPAYNQKQINTFATPELKSGIVPLFNYDDYNRILEFEDATYSTQTIGYGGSQEFYAGTGFFAPEDGFNLTHVMTWYSWSEVLESNIEVIIMGGADNLQDATVLHSQTYRHIADKASSTGEYITIELDEAQLLFPNEKFFIVFRYEMAVGYPQGTTTISNGILKRYYFGNGDIYFDLAEQGYNDMALMMKAAELEAGSNVWAILNSEPTGTIAKNESKTFSLSFVAQFAKQGINTANFIINSNDPYNSKVSVPLTLTHNQGPQYADGNKVFYSIQETDTLNYTLVVTDKEGDDFTLTIPEEYPYVHYTIDGSEVDIQFTPDYDGAGIHTIEVIGEDQHGNVNVFTLQVTVDNVNRAPVEEVEIGEQIIAMEMEEGLIIYLNDHIIDPDGDEITYKLSYENTDVVEMLHTGSTAVFMPIKLGYANISVVAFDPMGAKLETSFPAFIEHRIGIDEIELGDVVLYPNPAQNQLFLSIKDVDINIETFKIMDATGQVVLIPQVSDNESKMALNISSLSPGLYMLQLETKEGVLVKKFIKR